MRSGFSCSVVMRTRYRPGARQAGSGSPVLVLGTRDDGRLLDDIGLVRLVLQVGAGGTGVILVRTGRRRGLGLAGRLLDEADDVVVLDQPGVPPRVTPRKGAHRRSSRSLHG